MALEAAHESRGGVLRIAYGQTSTGGGADPSSYPAVDVHGAPAPATVEAEEGTSHDVFAALLTNSAHAEARESDVVEEEAEEAGAEVAQDTSRHNDQQASSDTRPSSLVP